MYTRERRCCSRSRKAAGLRGLRPALQDLASLAGMRLSAPLQRLGEARGTQAEARATGMSTGVGAGLDWESGGASV